MTGGGKVCRALGTVSPTPNTERGLMPCQQGQIGTEVYLNGAGVTAGGQDPLRYRNHLYGEHPATEVGHRGLTSCSPAFKLCDFR